MMNVLLLENTNKEIIDYFKEIKDYFNDCDLADNDEIKIIHNANTANDIIIAINRLGFDKENIELLINKEVSNKFDRQELLNTLNNSEII